MNHNLFNVINPNFFGLLSGKNKVSNFLLISEVSLYFGSQVIVERKRLIEYLADSIKTMHIESVGADEDEADYEEESIYSSNQFSQKANIFVNCLEKRGWLERDRTDEFVDIVQRTDAFLEIFDSLMKLIVDETDAKEQSTSLLALYRALKDFDYKNSTSSIESVEMSSNDLEKSILSINSKIKRFVDRVMSDPSLGEKEILKKLTIDYQKLPAFISFHNLLTTNNPNKYSAVIVDKIFELSSEETLNQLIDNYCKTKSLNIDEPSNRQKAKDYINNVFNKVISQIEDIEKSLNAISSRNHSYTSSSVDRINFRLNNERDIKGDINLALKLIKTSNVDAEFENDFDFYSLNQVDNKSIYTARALSKIAPKTTPFVKREPDPILIAKAKELLRQKELFSVTSINTFLKSQMGDRNQINASELFIDNIEDFIKLMLIPVYSTNSESFYKIERPTNGTFNCLSYEVEDYKIIAKEQ